MPTVELRFTPLPAHVRTARLVAVSLARRAGLDEEVLDEVRLAVGEAATRAVGRHRVACPAEPVLVRLTDGDGSFVAEVVDRATEAAPASIGSAEDREAADLAAVVSDQDADSSASSAPGSGRSHADDGFRGVQGGDDELPPGVDLAVISGLVDDVSVESTAAGSVVRMTWPVAVMNGTTPTGFGASNTPA